MNEEQELALLFEPLTERELSNLMFKEACSFLELQYGNQQELWKSKGYTLPKQFVPSSGDKMILREIINSWMEFIPKEARIRINAGELAQRVLFYDYYPKFDWFNKTQEF